MWGDKSSRRLFYLDLEAVGVCFILSVRQILQEAVYSGNIEVRVVSDWLQEAIYNGKIC